MREAMLGVALAVTAILAGSGAVDAVTSDPRAVVASALAGLDRGVMPSPNVVWTLGPDGPVERTATPDEVRDALLRARETLDADAGGNEPTSVIRDVGIGLQAPPGVAGACFGIETHLLAFSSDFTEPMTTYRVGVTGPTVGCGGSPGPFVEVTFDARRALASCSTCATSAATAWLNAPAGATHVNDFAQAHHRGYGTPFETQLCWAICITHAAYFGNAGTVELLAEPVHLPIPPTEFP